MLRQLSAYCFAVRGKEYKVDPALASAMNENYCSGEPRAERFHRHGAPCRVRGEPTRYACISAGRGGCSGPVRRLPQGGVGCCSKRSARSDRMPEYINHAKDKNESSRFIGFQLSRFSKTNPKPSYAEGLPRSARNCSVVPSRRQLYRKHSLELEHVTFSDDYSSVKMQARSQHRLLFGHHAEGAQGFPTDMFTVVYAITALQAGWTMEGDN